MPVRMDVHPASMESSIYPSWRCKQDTKPKGAVQARPYRTPKEEAKKKLTLQEELDAKSVFDFYACIIDLLLVYSGINASEVTWPVSGGECHGSWVPTTFPTLVA